VLVQDWWPVGANLLATLLKQVSETLPVFALAVLRPPPICAPSK
jgi:hypothetical protein